MKNSLQSIQRFIRDEDGAVAIEYGLLAVLVALIMAVGAGLLGEGLNTLFTNIAACFGSGSGACPSFIPSPF